MRKTERFSVKGSNSLWSVYKTVSILKVFKNAIVIEITRYIPWFPIKNWLYKKVLGMNVGEKTAFAYKVMVDLMFPEKITVGKNSIIGYNTTLLTHEYLIDEYRLGDIIIGDDVMIGANCTILPGVTIGDQAVIGAGTIVTKDVEAGKFVAGNPMRVINRSDQENKKK